MASVHLTSRSSAGTRMEALTRFVVESVMSTPSSERSPAPGTPTVEFTTEGRDFYGRVRSLMEDGEGGTAGTSQMSTFLSLIVSQMPHVLDATVTDGEIEAAFQVIASFIGSVSSTAEANAAVREVAAVLTAATTRAPLRLRILASVFSGCDVPRLKFELLGAILDFASATSQVSVVEGRVADIPAWCKAWKLSDDEQASLSLKLSTLFASINSTVKAYDALYRYLTLAKASEERNAVAVKAIGYMLTIPAHVIQSNLYRLDAVADLNKSASHKPAYELLQQFLNPSVSSFASFVKASGGFLSSVGVDAAAASQLVKVLALNNLLAAAGNEGSAVPFPDVAALLQVPLEAVGEYVVQGVDAGVFVAQIDELEQVVYPSTASDLVFETAQWEALKKRLVGMSVHVSELLAALKAETEADVE